MRLARLMKAGEGALMSISRLIVLPALALIGLSGFAFGEDAPVDLHPAEQATNAAPAAKPAKDAKSGPKQAISAAEAVRRANAWLESAQVLTADFVQIGPDHHRSEGKLTIERPGRMRFQFAPPEKLDIVADGRSVAVRDQKMDTQDLYFINQTPLKFLLADHIDLAKDTQVLRVETNDNDVSILIEDKATLGGSAQIDLLFDPTTFALKQWTVHDAQGFDTVVTLFNLDLTARPDESLFKIDEQRMIGQKK
jgi:outer membrane lipoprotein-sorting protein